MSQPSCTPEHSQNSNPPSTQWSRAVGRVNPGTDSIMVVDIGGTSIKLGWVSQGTVQMGTRREDTKALSSGDPIQLLAAMVKRFSAYEGFKPALVVVTIPGMIDRNFDTVLWSINVPQLNRRQVASELSGELDIPVVLERDTVLLLEGECCAGCATGVEHVLGVYFGTGIGGAFISHGEVLRGGGWALEIGHLRLRERENANQPFATESLESRCAGARLQELALAYDIPVEKIFSMRLSDTQLDSQLSDIVDEQALAIANAVTLLSPSVVVVGGGVVEMDDYPWSQLAKTVHSNTPIQQNQHPIDLRLANLGWQSVLYGILAIASRHLSAD